MIILTIGTIIRFNKYSSIGLYSRKVKWPKSYYAKIGIQIALIALILTQFILCFFATTSYVFRYLQLLV